MSLPIRALKGQERCILRLTKLARASGTLLVLMMTTTERPVCVVYPVRKPAALAQERSAFSLVDYRKQQRGCTVQRAHLGRLRVPQQELPHEEKP